MSNTVGEVNINLRLSLAQFKQDVKTGTGEASKASRDMANEFKHGTKEARDSVDLLSGSIGVHLPRELKNVIAQLPGVSSALRSAFSAVAVVAFAQVVIEAIGKIKEMSQEISGFGKEAQEAYAKLVEGNKQALKEAEDLKKKYRELALIGLSGSARDAVQKNIDVATQNDLEARLNQNLQRQAELRREIAAIQPTDPRAALGNQITNALKITEDRAGALNKELGSLSEEGRTLAASLKNLGATGAEHALQAQADFAKRADDAYKKLAETLFKVRQEQAKVLDALIPAKDPFGKLNELEETPTPINARMGPINDFASVFNTSVMKQNQDVLNEAKQVYDSTRTAAENYSNEIERLTNLLNAGVISQDTFDRAATAAGDKLNDTSKMWTELGSNIGETLKSAALFGRGWKDALGSIAIDLTQVIAKLIIMKTLGTAASAGGGGILSSIFSGLAGLGKAKGGPVRSGQGYPVGEEGVEWFQPDQHGTIIPHDALMAGAAGGGSTVVNNNSFHFEGVTDMDSFRKSQDQIASGMLAVMSRATRRNGG